MTWRPERDERPEQFVARVLNAYENEVTITNTRWNERHYLFVDLNRYTPKQDQRKRQLIALEQPVGSYRRIDVTVGEQERGEADFAAISFANSDRDAPQELVVVLHWGWWQRQFGVSGDFEVRLFENATPGQARLAPLPALSNHFGDRCECVYDNRPPSHFRFRTIAAVKRELKRLGY